ncbi:SIMPL domain-containing protein [Brevibacterium sp. JNUCC-42]|nr:SIMPL domain-containing protein [Brevibacterium sp. JNUCC-42]
MRKKATNKVVASFLTVGLLTGGSLFASVPAAHAQEVQVTRNISVTGVGSISIDPDVAYLQVGVETDAKTAKEAQEKNAKIFATVEKVLKQDGLSDKEVQTIQFSTNPQYNYDDKAGPVLTGYKSQHIIKVTYHNLNKIGNLLDKLSEAGANRIDTVQLSTDKQAQYEGQALTLAVQNAKAKAEALAKEAGVTVKKVLTISESNAAERPYMLAKSEMSLQDSPRGSSISTGQIKVETTVTVQFEIE